LCGTLQKGRKKNRYIFWIYFVFMVGVGRHHD